MRKSIFIFLISISIFTSKTIAQNIESYETKLQVLFEKLKFTKNDNIKDSINTIILREFEKCLNIEKSYDYTFSKLENISKITSDNDLVKIITWNLPYKNGEFKYFGFIQHYNKKQKTYITTKLFDNSNNITNVENVQLTSNNWYGALYYKMVEVKYKRETQYVLLAWDGNNNLSNKKVIEVLTFNKDNLPVFGKKVFKYENRIISRIIFEYSKQVKMVLRYDENHNMIIWDHLSPSKHELRGQYQFYGPDFSYDGLYFNKGIWDFYSNIKVKNSQ